MHEAMQSAVNYNTVDPESSSLPGSPPANKSMLSMITIKKYEEIDRIQKTLKLDLSKPKYQS